MRVLIVSDSFSLDTTCTWDEVLDANHVEAVISCGDLARGYFAVPASRGIPIYGVYGNHCAPGYLDTIDGAYNLHGGHITVLPNGMTCVGIEGCVRYKDEPDVLYTQDEYAQILSRYPTTGVDVVVTHCPPRGINDHTDHAHIGINALGPYLNATRPRHLLHGHTYPTKPITQVGQTRITYTYGHQLLDL